jgi:hypothetical protein
MNEYPDLVHPSMNGTLLTLPINERGGDTVYDQSGNHLDGALNGPTWTRDNNGSILHFDGSSHVDCGSDERLGFEGSMNFTVIVKFKAVDTGIQQTIINRQSAATGPYNGWSLRINGDDLKVIVRSASVNLADATSGNILSDNIWYTAVFTSDGLLGRYYLDGVWLNQDWDLSTVDSVISSIDAPLVLGRYSDIAGQYFTGDIAYAMVFGRTLTPNEIWYQYNYPWAAWYKDDAALFSAAIKAGGPPPTFNPALALNSNQVL